MLFTTIQILSTLLIAIGFSLSPTNSAHSYLFWLVLCFRKKVCCEIFIKTFFHSFFSNFNDFSEQYESLHKLRRFLSFFLLCNSFRFGAVLCCDLRLIYYLPHFRNDELNEPLILPGAWALALVDCVFHDVKPC